MFRPLGERVRTRERLRRGTIPSVRTLEKLAFRAFARLEVRKLPLVRNVARWRGLPKD